MTGWLRIPNCAANTERTRIAGDPARIRIPARFHSGSAHTVAFNPSARRERRSCPGASVALTSRSDWRLIQPATVRLPPIRTDTRACTARVKARFRRAPGQPGMRSMTVIVPLEIEQLHLQISGRPE
jgi:hypothetical protein